MEGDHFLQKTRFGLHDIFDGLVGFGIGQEPNEITGMTGLNGHTDFAFGLESGDAGAVPRARINDHEWSLDRVDWHRFWRNDARQHIVNRSGKIVTVHHQLSLHAEHVGRLLGHVPLILVATLAHDVCIQNAALPGIRQVFGCGSHHRRHKTNAGGLALVGNGHGRLLCIELPLIRPQMWSARAICVILILHIIICCTATNTLRMIPFPHKVGLICILPIRALSSLRDLKSADRHPVSRDPLFQGGYPSERVSQR